jgi:hypothetical protein
MSPRIFGRIYRRLLSIPADIALSAINVPAVEAKLLSELCGVREKHSKNLPKLSNDDAAIVSGLERDGFYVTSLDELALNSSKIMFEAGQDLAAAYKKRVSTQRSWGRADIVAEPKEVLKYPEIFRWGLEARLRCIVECYLGLPIAYDGMHMFYTVANGRETGTRMWHRDREDRRVVRVAVYLNDVDEHGGPFQVLNKKSTATTKASFQYPMLKDAKLSAWLGHPVTERDVKTFTGRAGTVIFCDTARQYHRGKPAISHDRGALFYCYFSRTPRHPFYCERSGISREEIVKLAVSFTPEERDAVLWRENLPLIARMIPKSIA